MIVIDWPDDIGGLRVIAPGAHRDERGFLVETYSERRYAGIEPRYGGGQQ